MSEITISNTEPRIYITLNFNFPIFDNVYDNLMYRAKSLLSFLNTIENDNNTYVTQDSGLLRCIYNGDNRHHYNIQQGKINVNHFIDRLRGDYAVIRESRTIGELIGITMKYYMILMKQQMEKVDIEYIDHNLDQIKEFYLGKNWKVGSKTKAAKR